MDTRLMFLLTLTLATTGCSLLGSKNTPSGDAEWKTVSASPIGNNAVTNSDTNLKSGGFTANLPEGFTHPTDDAGRRLLKEYGAVFVARGGAVPPPVVFFKDEAAVTAFQAAAGSSWETVGGVSVELQSAAMKALQVAVAEANQAGASITPRGSDASKRRYRDTVALWKSRVDPGLEHWSGKARISAADAARIRLLSPFEQIPEIFKLEADKIYFAKDLSKSIVYSVAPPGSSQHLSMLALDVSEHDNEKVRSILAKHGWFQTVISDLPHFTFLGVPETELTKLGLKKNTNGDRIYWVPDI